LDGVCKPLAFVLLLFILSSTSPPPPLTLTLSDVVFKLVDKTADVFVARVTNV